MNKSNKYLLGVVEESKANGADCFMIFTGAPHNLRRANISELYLNQALEKANMYNIDFSNCVVHAPYIFNLASPDHDGYIARLLQNEIERMISMGIRIFVVHPGYHTGYTKVEGIRFISENLSNLFKNTPLLHYVLCLETMSGKKNQIGDKLEDFREIFKKCRWEHRLGICLDTCHMHDSGYDLSNLDELKREIVQLIGLERVKLLHLGDSMNTMGSKKDRHANLGMGYIGWETIVKWAYDPNFSKIPIIVETPYWREKNSSKRRYISPYQHEIQLLRNKIWMPIPDDRFQEIFNIKNVTSKVS